jgi:hypothetical protein
MVSPDKCLGIENRQDSRQDRVDERGLSAFGVFTSFRLPAHPVAMVRNEGKSRMGEVKRAHHVHPN